MTKEMFSLPLLVPEITPLKTSVQAEEVVSIPEYDLAAVNIVTVSELILARKERDDMSMSLIAFRSKTKPKPPFIYELVAGVARVNGPQSAAQLDLSPVSQYPLPQQLLMVV